ncbi:hypothetical protein AVEN_244255-1 [Araneus ventricosus]|uniref:Uncharacterized protein n=1 Tax=Araneus ventricosus TaxID=182803 RepID=A0A4Y2KNI0_ARAVE|nr:hypothetical protein AVEN_244255-1 [Araneus ventricosus]
MEKRSYGAQRVLLSLRATCALPVSRATCALPVSRATCVLPVSRAGEGIEEHHKYVNEKPPDMSAGSRSWTWEQ